jgi:hypothetical protein
VSVDVEGEVLRSAVAMRELLVAMAFGVRTVALRA